jgi:cyclic beta-1,2-glucan synthetase
VPLSTAHSTRTPLRGEILSAEALGARARALGTAHPNAAPVGPTRPLLDEFRRTRDDLLAAYRAIEAATRQREDAVPAEEWLLDNFHTVDEQLREVVEDLPRGYLARLPRLPAGPQAGYPRVYLLARDLVTHTDARIDRENLLLYVAAYQESAPLTIGELWAVPIMLRVSLIENLCALAQEELAARAERVVADRWADRLVERTRQRAADGVVAVAQLATSDQPLTDGFVVQLLKRLRDEDLAMGPAFAWIDERLAEAGTAAEETTRRERQRQAVNQVSVGNSITSMRLISALDWMDFFDRTSLVERELGRDLAGAYAAMDARSRDHYRHAIEQLAARSRLAEPEVARRAVAQAESERDQDVAAMRRRHVGYALVDAGRPAFEAALGYQPTLGERLQRGVLGHPLAVYLGAIGLLLAALLAGPLLLAQQAGVNLGLIVLMALLLLLPASELAGSVVNFAVTRWLPPRLLFKLALGQGIPASGHTVVVVPAMLTAPAAVQKLVADLEIRYLANVDPRLDFALLTDFPDAAAAEQPDDAALLDVAREAITALNRRHAGESGDRFLLLHRRRCWNPQQGVWMGWERKRGKLEEFNRLLRGATDTSFGAIVGDVAMLRDVRYVITLDADTALPRDAARKLVGTIAHPLNQAVFDPRCGRVTAGYGIVQPRVSTTLVSAGRSLFARIFTGNTIRTLPRSPTRTRTCLARAATTGKGSTTSTPSTPRWPVACPRTACLATICSKAYSPARAWRATSSCSTNFPRTTRSTPGVSIVGCAVIGSSCRGCCQRCPGSVGVDPMTFRRSVAGSSSTTSGGACCRQRWWPCSRLVGPSYRDRRWPGRSSVCRLSLFRSPRTSPPRCSRPAIRSRRATCVASGTTCARRRCGYCSPSSSCSTRPC